MDTFNFLLYTPENAVKNMPLIVYLHGGSGKGEQTDLIISVEGFPKYVNKGQIKNIPAYIVFPQVPSSQRGWAEIKVSVKELIDYMCETYSIDKTRISLTGHSMGGTGTWAVALAYPELFSAVAPMSGSIKNTPENINTLSNTPVWAFVGSADTIVDPALSSDFVYALQERNPYAKITIFQGATHFDVPSLAYLDTNLNVVNWLIKNVRENKIINFSSGKISVKTEIPGRCALILIDYDEKGQINNIKTINKDFNFGKTEIFVPDDIVLGKNDKIMLWSDIIDLKPLCCAYTVQ